MTKKAILEAMRRSRATASLDPDSPDTDRGIPERIGAWEVWCEKIYMRRGRFAWYWQWYAKHDDEKHKIGGYRHMASTADIIIKHER